MRAILGRFLAALLLAGPAAVEAAPAEATGVSIGPAPAWVAPPRALPENADPRASGQKLVYLARDTQILARGTASERYEYHALRINQPGALAAAGTIAIPYAASFQDIALNALRIRREGRVIDLLGQTAFRVLSQESSLAHGVLIGNRTAVTQVPDLRVGDVLEYAYLVRGANPVFGDRPAFHVTWNSILPLATRRVRVVDPAARLQVRVMSPRGAEALDLRQVATGLGRETIIEGRELASVYLEPNLPAGFDPFVTIAFTPFGSWQEVGVWAEDLFRTRADASTAYGELLARLKKLPARRAAVAEAVRFVQDDIRYFSLAIGENAYRPYAPSEVLARRYGDCKDKTLLLAQLLRGLGVAAHPALVSVHRKGGIGRYPASPNVFDHAIVNFRFEGRDFWIDPTRASLATDFDRQGSALAGAKALRVGAGDASLVDIPAGADNGLAVVETVGIRALDAPVGFRIETRLSGELAEVMRKAHARRGQETNEREYRDTFARRYAGASAPSPVQIRDEPGSGALLLTENYEVADFLRSEGLDKKFAPLGAHQLIGWLTGSGQRQRLYPFAIPGGRGSFRYEATVNFPETVAGREDPIANTVANRHFRLESNRSFRGATMRVSAVLTILDAEVAPEEFAGYLDEVKKARQSLFDFVLISPENLQADAGAKPTPLAERQRREDTELEARLTKALDSGRLGDSERAEAHTRRGLARFTLGNSRAALDDLNAAIRLRPSAQDALSTRALVHFRDGRLAAAEEDLTRAIVLGAEPSGTYLRRGHVRFMAGRHAEALADFEQADKANAVGLNRDFGAIWQALSLRALGRDAAAKFAPQLARDKAERWPNPILALLIGQASVAQVLRAAEGRTADERDANRCEAHFYIGQYQLLQGEREAAIESFRASVATGITHFMEYDMARLALEQLGAGAAR